MSNLTNTTPNTSPGPVDASSLRWELTKALTEAYGDVAARLLPRVATEDDNAEVRKLCREVYASETAQAAERMVNCLCHSLGIKPDYIRRQARALFRHSIEIKGK